jgi:hypothetical protein
MREPLLTITAIILLAGSVLAWRRLEEASRPLDQKKLKTSAKLQRMWSPREVRTTVESWSTPEARSAAREGLLIDAFMFVPLYAGFLAVASLLLSRWLPAGSIWSRMALAMACCGFLSGVFDQIENLGSYLELKGFYAIAALTFAASIVKWCCIGAAFPAAAVLFGAVLLLG